MKKNLTMTMIVASLMALAALATLFLAGGAAATVRSSKIIEIPFGAYAHATGTDLYCKNTKGGNGVHIFSCYVIKGTGAHMSVAGNSYQATIADAGVEVDKSNFTGTASSLTQVYGNS